MNDKTRLLLDHYRKAGETTAQLEGGLWYRESAREARRIARATGRTYAQAAGVIAAISPRMRWAANVSLAEDLCAGREVQGVFGANLRKAQRILEGQRPLDVLGGDKVRAFYRAIMGDEDSVVIDVWMLRAVGWTKPSLTSREYEAVSDCLRAAASVVGVSPADFQAIVWTQVRGGAE